MTRQTFIKKMKHYGFVLQRDGNYWYLTKDFDDGSNNEIVLFLKKHTYTSSEDSFSKLHKQEWCDFRAWKKGQINNGRLIGGEIDFLPFSMVDQYISFFNNLYQTIKHESNT